MAKLGLASRVELVQRFPPAGGCPRAGGAEALTAAEAEILALLLTGRSNAEIAAARGTSSKTVANQLYGLYRKLGVCSRAELAARART